MEKRNIRVKGSRLNSNSMGPTRDQILKVAEKLFCPCGCLIYEGPKPDFSRISCPKCKLVMDVPQELRK